MNGQEKKKLPIGISDYEELRNGNCYYVDKSLLIKDLEESGKVVLVARPRRSGKTLNLSMLCYFFEINEHSNSSLFFDTAYLETAPISLTAGNISGHFSFLQHSY